MSTVKLRLSAASKFGAMSGCEPSTPVSMMPTSTSALPCCRVGAAASAWIMLHVPLQVGERLAVCRLGRPRLGLGRARSAATFSAVLRARAWRSGRRLADRAVPGDAVTEQSGAHLPGERGVAALTTVISPTSVLTLVTWPPAATAAASATATVVASVARTTYSWAPSARRLPSPHLGPLPVPAPATERDGQPSDDGGLPERVSWASLSVADALKPPPRRADRTAAPAQGGPVAPATERMGRIVPTFPRYRASGGHPTLRRTGGAEDLFGAAVEERLAPPGAAGRPAAAPHARRVVGQEHLVGPGRPLRALIEEDRLSSVHLLGPAGHRQDHPGPARSPATTAKAFEQLSAVSAAVKDVREVMERARDRLGEHGQGTILFLDEIHRFNKAQQDALLPGVEEGLLTLIGATTENPFFEVNPPLRQPLHPLPARAARTATRSRRWPSGAWRPRAPPPTPDAVDHLVDRAGGDGRQVLTALEVAVAPGHERRGRRTS